MIVTVTHRNLFLFIVYFLLLLNKTSSTRCKRSCGESTPKKFVQFPFGFSEDCEIRLNCSANGQILIGDFHIQDVTPHNLLVSLPAKCNRPIHSLRQLFTKNYAITSQNGLILANCSSNQSTIQQERCMVSESLVRRRFGLQGCNAEGQNISCFSNEEIGNKRFLDLRNATERNCGLLLSAIAIAIGVDEADGWSGSKTSRFAVEFEKLQLGWWLEGKCNCSSDANCIEIVNPMDGRPGFRCLCKDGFEGDGFKSGHRCRKVSSKCNSSKYMWGRCGGTTRLIGVLIGGIIAGASLMSGLALLCCFIRRKTTSLKSQKSTRRLLTEAAGSCNVPYFCYKEIERATNGFSEKHRLGTGAYGTVYAGKMHNDEWVAIKKIRHRDAEGIEQVMNEIKLLSSVSHPNLVRLLGYCIERGEQILVYEFMPNGTLSQHLQRERGTGLPWTVRLTIATETAEAIAHLHSAKNPPIYHRDIKSSNILLDQNFNSKVADFGLSRLGMMTESSHISTAPQGTPGYLDPQYHQNFHLSDKSDVYSFGVVLVEIITALKVVDFNRPHCQVNLAALAIDKIGKGCVDEIIDPFIEPHRDAWTLSSVHKVAELAFRCLAFHSDMRPSMMEVAAELEYIRLSAWAPLEDNAFTKSSCSSPSNVSDRSHIISKSEVESSRRLVVSQRSACMIVTGEAVKDSSPVSVHDPWFSEQSSPSSNSLLDNVIN